MSILGTRVVRTEDPRLLTAGGTYVDDLRVPELAGAARVTFVRSPIAHAMITGLDVSAARAAPGVLAVLTAQDLDKLPAPPANDGTGPDGSEGAPVPLGGLWAEPLLAADRVRYVGEPVAIVLTDGSYRGEDAAALVSVDYQPLPPVVGVAGALAAPALLFPGTSSNVAVAVGAPAREAPDGAAAERSADSSAFDGSAFDGCDVVIEHTIENQRLAPAPLEGRAAAVEYTGGRPTFPFGTHLAVTEVDTETGKARLVRLVTVDDAGTVVNPVLAEGQRHGGIAQGVAQALLEEVLYDPDGNPLTGTLADYAMITAAELPSFELLHGETPTDVNPLGAKGIGEAGTIGAAPATQNAVIDAVSHVGVRHIDMPATPARVWAALSAARESRPGPGDPQRRVGECGAGPG